MGSAPKKFEGSMRSWDRLLGYNRYSSLCIGLRGGGNRSVGCSSVPNISLFQSSFFSGFKLDLFQVQSQCCGSELAGSPRVQRWIHVLEHTAGSVWTWSESLGLVARPRRSPRLVESPLGGEARLCLGSRLAQSPPGDEVRLRLTSKLVQSPRGFRGDAAPKIQPSSTLIQSSLGALESCV